MTGRPRLPTRRGFLAVASLTALAGCNGVGGDLLSDDPPELDGGDLREVSATDPPSVPETVPVEIRRAYLDRGVGRARDLLSSVPAPFDAEEIPNGAMREKLAHRYEQAEEGIGSVERAESPLEATESLHGAREDARAVAAGWRAIGADLSRADLRRSARELRDAVERFGERRDYLGDDPVRALLVHATVESRMDGATNRVEGITTPGRVERDDPIALGETAGRIEAASASLDDAEYLYRRLRATTEGDRTFRSGFAAAAESLASLVGRRRDRLPDGDPDDPSSFVDGDVDGTPVALAVRELAEDLRRHDEFGRSRETGEYARAVVSGHERLVRVRALEGLRGRVARGDHVTVEEVDDVRALRRRAIAAVEDVLAADAHPDLNRRELAEVVGLVGYADAELERYDADRSVPVDSVVRPLSHYVQAAAMVRAIPESSEEVASLVARSV